MPSIKISDSTFSLVLLLSFVPFMIKSVSYIEVGNFIPFAVMDIIGLPLIYGFYFGKLWVISWLKVWAVIMIVFGFARLGLALMVKYTDVGVEAHILDQINPGFIFLCVGYILAGFYLTRNARRVLIMV